MTILLLLSLMLFFNVPVMMVWIQNLSVWWFSDADHNVLLALPVTIYVTFYSEQLPDLSVSPK